MPVRAVGVYKTGNWYQIETDTGNKGYGATVMQALRNMKETASGIIYLDTADYMILTSDTEKAVMELESELRPAVRLCAATKQIDLSNVADYLDAHDALPSLRDHQKGAEIPVISTFGDAITFLKKVEKSA